MSTDISRGSVPLVPSAAAGPAALAVRRLYRVLEAALMVAAERRRLAELDDRLLSDIGISGATADYEASRDFFDVPKHRIRRG